MKRSRTGMTSSFRGQIVILTACVTAFAMIALTIVLQLILADLSRTNVDTVLEDRADAVVSTVSDADSQGLAVTSAELDTGVVVYDAQGASVAGVASSALADIYDELSTTGTTTYRTAGDTARVLALPFLSDAGDQGVVVLSERLGPYEAAERYALIVSIITGALATAAAAAIAAWVTTRALRPVGVLARTATDWSEHDLSRRFDLGAPTNEITALAATLDTLLDKVSAAIHTEQRLTADLAHELRTPLTAVQGAADLALLQGGLPPYAQEGLEEISAASHRMSETITTLLDVARNADSLRQAATCSIAAVVDDVTGKPAADGPGVEVRVEVVDHQVAAPHSVAVRALAPVLANALRFADSRVTVTVAASTTGMVDVVVEDDGPGVGRGDPDRIFQPGVSSTGGSGAGLGLSISRRMARSVGGDLELTDAGPPTRFVLRLPLA
ncbi:HAMP domain-containing sensor histidine kinase [Nocardioides sp.]|uniref:sensor histidine kinase n=1 Tax=Nocardioides sp. TaxID=35761 RepID=UPI00286B9BEB|nr:HAMP domain-containing sensor histidine kinase [Nocardioides sp.]